MEKGRFTPEQSAPIPHTLRMGEVWTPFREGQFPVDQLAFRIQLPIMYEGYPGNVVLERTTRDTGTKAKKTTTIQAAFPDIGRRDPFRKELDNTVLSVVNPQEDTVLTFQEATEEHTSGVISPSEVLYSYRDAAMKHTEIEVMSASDYVRSQQEKKRRRLQIQKQLGEAYDHLDWDSPIINTLYENAKVQVLRRIFCV